MNVDAPTRCEWCGANIVPNSRGGTTRRFCDATCRRNAHRQRSEAWTIQQETDPQLASLRSLEDAYTAEHAGETDPPTWGDDCESPAETALATWGIVPGVPSPENSTVDHVSATLRAAQAIAAELRRHGLAAPGLLAPRCAEVAAAIDAALAAQFGDVL